MVDKEHFLSSADVDIVLSIATPGAGKPTEVVLGYMQDLQASEMFHMQPIRSIWNPLVSSFVTGIKECHGTARRAFIEWDNTLGLLDMVSEMNDSLMQFNNFMRAMATGSENALAQVVSMASGVSAISSMVEGFNTVQAGKTSLTSIQDLQKNNFSIGDVLSKVSFDLLIRYPMLNSSNDIVHQPIWRLKDCFLDSRSVVITVGNIIVLEEISFVFRDFKEEHWSGSV